MRPTCPIPPPIPDGTDCLKLHSSVTVFQTLITTMGLLRTKRVSWSNCVNGAGLRKRGITRQYSAPTCLYLPKILKIACSKWLPVATNILWTICSSKGGLLSSGHQELRHCWISSKRKLLYNAKRWMPCGTRICRSHVNLVNSLEPAPPP